jgi:hypothetical protein
MIDLRDRPLILIALAGALGAGAVYDPADLSAALSLKPPLKIEEARTQCP